MINAGLLRPFFCGALCLLPLVVLEPASANLVTWRLQNVTFEDGGTATGFFVYDSAGHSADRADLLVRFDISVSASVTSARGYQFEAFHYACDSYQFDEHCSSSSTRGTLQYLFLEPYRGGSSRKILTLIFASPLSAAQGAVPIVTYSDTLGSSHEYIEPLPQYPWDTNARMIVSGGVAAIPEAAPLCFVALGAILLWLRARPDGYSPNVIHTGA